jgi:hypothetical protein
LLLRLPVLINTQLQDREYSKNRIYITFALFESIARFEKKYKSASLFNYKNKEFQAACSLVITHNTSLGLNIALPTTIGAKLIACDKQIVCQNLC